jgi:hypothetical protein
VNIGMFVSCGLCALVSLICNVAAAAEITGTAFSLIYRGPDTSISRADSGGKVDVRTNSRGNIDLRIDLPDQRQRSMRDVLLLDARTGVHLARAKFDRRIDGHFFQLPIISDVTRTPTCLMIKGLDGATIPVRDAKGNDDGYTFRHPLWESAVKTQFEKSGLAAERNRLTAKLEADLRTLSEVYTALGMSPTDAFPVCQLGPTVPQPLRPKLALVRNEAEELSKGLCAAEFGSYFLRHRTGLTTLFTDAGHGPAWAAAGTENLSALAGEVGPKRLVTPPSDEEVKTVISALNKGRQSFDYATATKAINAFMGACRGAVIKLSAETLDKWDADKKAAEIAPQTAKSTCEARVAQVTQLRAAIQKGEAYRSALEQKLSATGTNSSYSEKTRLDLIPCQ